MKVEWKKLGEVCEFQNGFAFKSNLFRLQGESIVRITNIASNKVDMSDSKFFDLGDYPNCNLTPFKVENGEILLAMSGATTGKVGMYIGNNKAYINQRVGKFIPKKELLDNNYLYHFLLSKNKDLYIMAGGGAQPNLSSNRLMEELTIPILSIREQQVIAIKLDTFTSSIENLKEQITQRRKQYEYYRDQLLDLEGRDGVEMKTLGEIGDVCMCKRIMKEQTSNNDEIPFYKIGTFGGKADAFITRELFEEYKSKYSYPKLGEILISASGTIGRSVVFNGEDAYFQDSNIVWIANNETIVTNRYLYYFYQIAEWKTDGGTIKRLYNYNLKNTTIPVPSLSEQSRIVSILDTFEASIQNLEAQLSERQKQYEYYRNKLLTFE